MTVLIEYLDEVVREIKHAADKASAVCASGLKSCFKEDAAQGTTEYAILVGVLVVIAIVAIIAFRDRVSELWSAISDGINGL